MSPNIHYGPRAANPRVHTSADFIIVLKDQTYMNVLYTWPTHAITYLGIQSRDGDSVVPSQAL